MTRENGASSQYQRGALTGIVGGGIASTVMVATAISGAVAEVAGYVGHLAACMGATIWVLGHDRAFRDDGVAPSDAAMSILGLIGLTVAGLPGALMAMGVPAWARRFEADGADRLAWFRTLSGRVDRDPIDRIVDQLAASRLLQPDAAQPENFHQIIDHGSRRDRQTVLGIIGLHYNPSYRPLLMKALASHEPTIRVQAAAVMLKLRAATKLRMERALADVRDSKCSTSSLAAFEACLASGFLEAAERQRVFDGARRWMVVSRRAQTPWDDTQNLSLSRIFADGGDHSTVVQLLQSRANASSLDELEIGARSLMALGRHRDAGRLLARHRDGCAP